MGENLRRKGICIVSKYFPLPKILTNYKGKDSNFTLGKPSRKEFSQVFEVNLTSNNAVTSGALSYVSKRRTKHHSGTANKCNLIPIMKILAKPSGGGAFDKMVFPQDGKVMKIGVVDRLYGDHSILACWCLCHCIIPTPEVQAERLTCFQPIENSKGEGLSLL